MRASTFFSALVFATLLSATGLAQSAPSADDLFREGRAAMARGDYATARDKLVASQKIAPAAGTLLNLGDCLEHLGLTASAWETYIEARESAEKRQRQDWVHVASERIRLLEPKLAKIRVADPALGEGHHIEVDGREADPLTARKGMAVDPGVHSVVVVDAQSWERSGKVEAKGGQIVDVVFGAPTARPPKALASPPPSTPSAIKIPPTPPPEPHVKESGATPVLPWIFAGAAVASATVGGVLFAIRHGERVHARDELTALGCVGALSSGQYARCDTVARAPMSIAPPAIAFVLGGGFAIAAIATYIATTPSKATPGSAATCVPGVMGGSCTLRF